MIDKFRMTSTFGTSANELNIIIIACGALFHCYQLEACPTWKTDLAESVQLAHVRIVLVGIVRQLGKRFMFKPCAELPMFHLLSYLRLGRQPERQSRS